MDFVMGALNARGFTCRGSWDGGEQERSLIEKYGLWSDALRDEWPRTSDALSDIAREYGKQAGWHDQDRTQNEWRT